MLDEAQSSAAFLVIQTGRHQMKNEIRQDDSGVDKDHSNASKNRFFGSSRFKTWNTYNTSHRLDIKTKTTNPILLIFFLSENDVMFLKQISDRSFSHLFGH